MPHNRSAYDRITTQGINPSLVKRLKPSRPRASSSPNARNASVFLSFDGDGREGGLMVQAGVVRTMGRSRAASAGPTAKPRPSAGFAGAMRGLRPYSLA